mgnify:CR=1 FL=1
MFELGSFSLLYYSSNPGFFGILRSVVSTDVDLADFDLGDLGLLEALTLGKLLPCRVLIPLAYSPTSRIYIWMYTCTPWRSLVRVYLQEVDVNPYYTSLLTHLRHALDDSHNRQLAGCDGN